MEITLDDKTADLLRRLSIGDPEKEVRKILKAHAMDEFEKQIRWHHDHALRLIRSKTKVDRCIEVANRLHYDKPLPEPLGRLHKALKLDVFTHLHQRIQEDCDKAQRLSEQIDDAWRNRDRQLAYKLKGKWDSSEALKDTDKARAIRRSIEEEALGATATA